MESATWRSKVTALVQVPESSPSGHPDVRGRGDLRFNVWIMPGNPSDAIVQNFKHSVWLASVAIRRRGGLGFPRVKNSFLPVDMFLCLLMPCNVCITAVRLQGSFHSHCILKMVLSYRERQE